MSTYRTHFEISNETQVPITNATIIYDEFDYDGTLTPKTIPVRVAGQTAITQTIPLVNGDLPIAAGTKINKPLELKEGISNDSKFILGLLFENGTFLQFDVKVKLAYEDAKENEVPVEQFRGNFTVWQKSARATYTNTYSIR